jgi:hypothetical protein
MHALACAARRSPLRARGHVSRQPVSARSRALESSRGSSHRSDNQMTTDVVGNDGGAVVAGQKAKRDDVEDRGATTYVVGSHEPLFARCFARVGALIAFLTGAMAALVSLPRGLSGDTELCRDLGQPIPRSTARSTSASSVASASSRADRPRLSRSSISVTDRWEGDCRGLATSNGSYCAWMGLAACRVL